MSLPAETERHSAATSVASRIHWPVSPSIAKNREHQLAGKAEILIRGAVRRRQRHDHGAWIGKIAKRRSNFITKS